jgi:hypothetical protein
MTARVRGVIAAAIAAGSMLSVSRSMSAKTGLAPARTTAFAQDTNVKLGSTTSSPGPTPARVTAASNADVQEFISNGRAPSSSRPSALSASRP